MYYKSSNYKHIVFYEGGWICLCEEPTKHGLKAGYIHYSYDKCDRMEKFSKEELLKKLFIIKDTIQLTEKGKQAIRNILTYIITPTNTP